MKITPNDLSRIVAHWFETNRLKRASLTSLQNKVKRKFRRSTKETQRYAFLIAFDMSYKKHLFRYDFNEEGLDQKVKELADELST